MNKNVSLKDIAAELGLSTTAVSKSLRDSSDISAETKEKVRSKADEMGYIPNNIALSLKQGKTNNVAVIINDLLNPFFAALCDIVFKKLKVLGYQASIYFSNKHLLGIDDMNNVFHNRCCGVISFVEPLDQVADVFYKNNVPFILIGINSRNPYVNSVYTDDYLGGKVVGDFFIKLEKNKAFYITNSFSETSYRRYSGFSDVILQNNKDVDLLPFVGSDDQSLLDAAIKKISMNNYEFIFCFSDYLAIRLTRKLKSRKLLKKTTYIFGYDNLNKYYNIIEKTNSVTADYEQILDYAIANLIREIKEGRGPENFSKMFPVELSLR